MRRGRVLTDTEPLRMAHLNPQVKNHWNKKRSKILGAHLISEKRHEQTSFSSFP